jgi:hypothetical protein
VNETRRTAQTPCRDNDKAGDTREILATCKQQRIHVLTACTVLLWNETLPRKVGERTRTGNCQEIQMTIKHTVHHLISLIIRQIQTKGAKRDHHHPSGWFELKWDGGDLVCGIWGRVHSVCSQWRDKYSTTRWYLSWRHKALKNLTTAREIYRVRSQWLPWGDFKGLVT